MPFKNPHPLYGTWINMKQRCFNPSHPLWARYGGRGITVCERWRSSFANFLADMGERPEGMSLDRIDNDAGYSPENCRWATQVAQSRNQHRTRHVTIDGRRYKAVELAEASGVKTDTILTRAHRGHPLARVMSVEPLERDPTEHRASMAKAIAASSGKRREASHCQRGHEFTPENTQITRNGAGRRCKACCRLRDARYR